MIDSHYKVITFDLDDTLWPVEPVIRHAEDTAYQWLQENCPRLTSEYSLAELTERRKAYLLANLEQAHQISQLRIDSWREALLSVGLTVFEAKKIAEGAFSVFIDARHQINYFDQALETLEALSGHYIVGALSNGNACVQRLGLNQFFDFHLSAETVGSQKPNPGHFTATLQKTGVSPEQIVHVGDHPEHDIIAAQQAGFDTIWINPEHLPWKGSKSPTLVVDTIADVIEGIKKLEHLRNG